MATHSSILARKTPQTAEPGRLQFMGSQRVGHDWVLSTYNGTCCTVLRLVTQWSTTLCYHMDCSPPGSSVHADSPGKNTGVGCHALLQGIFHTQGSNPGLPHCRQILYCQSHQRSPWKLESVVPLFQRIFLTQEWTGVLCIPGRYFTSWATREAYSGVRVSEICSVVSNSLWLHGL